jgi:adenylyl-sulfate kinase
LDGDDLRRGLSSDLGFEARDRSEHARRAVEVAHVLAGDGITAIVALISPGREDRARARARCGAELFVEVFVDAPLAVCERRDPKGLYAKARRGDLSGFTGIGSSYEPPARPDVWLKTDQMTVEACVAAVVHHAWANHTV